MVMATSWQDPATVDRMLGGADTDSFAVGSVSGFGWRPVNHRDWFAPAPGTVANTEPAR